MRRVAAAAWSALCLTAMVAVPPWALVVWFGNPLPSVPFQQPYLHEWTAAAGVAFGWLLWLGLVVLVGWHVRLAIRQVRLPHLRMVAPPAGLLAGLAGAVVVGAATVASRGSTVPAMTPATAAGLPQTVDAPAPVLGDNQPPAGGTGGQDLWLDGDPVPTGNTERDAPPGGAASAGVVVPGSGWVPTDLARAVTAASAVVWIRRRRRYIPRPTGVVDTADLVALPPTAQAITAGWLEHQPTDRLPDTGGGPEPAGRLTAGPPTPGVIGSTPDGPLRLADLPPGGVGLDGPAGVDAARGMLTAALVNADPPWSPTVQVVTVAPTLTVLFGAASLPYQRLPGLTVCPDWAALVDLLETQIVARNHNLAGHTAAGGPVDAPQPTQDAPAPDAATRPLLVVAVTPPAEMARRVAVALTASTLGIHGLLLGRWQHGTTWQVDPHGHVHTDPHRPDRLGTTGPRLCVLPAAAARDLLTVHALAQPTPLDPPPPAAAAEQVIPAGPVGWGEPGWPAPAPAAPLQVRLLGDVAVTVSIGGQPVTLDLQRRRRAALQILVLLALHPGGASSADLAAALWPGEHPRPATRVYNPASQLRTALAHATGRDLVIRDGDVYRLDHRHLAVDLWRLHTALAQAAATTDPGLRAGALTAAVDAYTGELAAGRAWPWLDPYRETLRRQIITAYTTLAADTDPDTAATLLTRAHQTDPYNEHLHHAAITAHTTAGHHHTAVSLAAAHAARLAAIGEPPTPNIDPPTR